ncbi:Retrovirus-related Pol poly from transposon, partial [Paramuricea clavata]
MATSSRTSVALPETFSDGDIVLWLRKFELCSTANDWKDTDMLKRLPTLLSGKAFAVFERLAAEAKEDYKTLTKALTAAFGGDTTGKHLAMMAFRSRTRKPDEDIQVFAYNLEALLRRAMPKIENGDRDVLLQQQFIEGVPTELKRELLQRPSMSYEEMVAVAQQLDLVSQISSHQTGSQVNLASASDNLQTTTRDQPLVAQLMENVETLTRKPTAVFKTRVGAHEQKCLVDTGATVSLISRELISGPLKPCSLKARGIGGEELQVLGMKELEVSIGTLTISHQFMVVGMRNTCILGADFLKSGRMVVDIANSKLTWPSGEVALVIETTAPTVNKLSILLDNYSDIFVSGPNHPLGRTTLAEHSIDTGDSRP